MDDQLIFNAYCHIKNGSKKFWTNIYSLSPLDALKNLNKKSNFFLFDENALIAIESRGVVSQIHFLFSAEKKSMHILSQIKIRPLVLDLIDDGRSEIFIESLPYYGFYLYGSLKRMTQTGGNKLDFISTENIKYVNLREIDFLSDLYIKYFDHSVDRIPNYAELESLINRNLVICTRDGDFISAFASISITSGIAVLNHIFVRPEFRGKGLGEGLLRSFLYIARESKSVRLWVVPDNAPAISMYRKYNFEFDGLKNLIYKNEK